MKNRIAIFIFGLLAGVAIGVVFDVGIKAIINQVRKLDLSISRINSQQDKISQRLDSIQGKLKDNKNNTPVAIKGPFKTPIVAPVNVQKHDSIARKQKEADDSLGDNIDSTVVMEGRDSNIVVMTNQLVSVKSLPLNSLDSLTKAGKVNHKSDSVIAAMSNVSEEQDPRYYRIEFWQSPLNFRGYKMSKGKIVLYGINSNADMKLVKWDDEYYLMSNQVVYKVEYTDDYKPFEKVMDKTVLKKITL
jgi:hypothetical protein